MRSRMSKASFDARWSCSSVPTTARRASDDTTAPVANRAGRPRRLPRPGRPDEHDEARVGQPDRVTGASVTSSGSSATRWWVSLRLQMTRRAPSTPMRWIDAWAGRKNMSSPQAEDGAGDDVDDAAVAGHHDPLAGVGDEDALDRHEHPVAELARRSRCSGHTSQRPLAGRTAPGHPAGGAGRRRRGGSSPSGRSRNISISRRLVDDRDLEAVVAGDLLAGLVGPLEVRAVDGGDRSRRPGPADGLGLPAAELGQRRVDPVGRGPARAVLREVLLAVAHEDQLAGLAVSVRNARPNALGGSGGLAGGSSGSVGVEGVVGTSRVTPGSCQRATRGRRRRGRRRSRRYPRRRR